MRDERPHAGAAPPAVLYRYTPDRKGEHCRSHLASFAGHLHADGYSGFNELYEAKDAGLACVTEVACWAHVRRKFFDVHKSNGSPIAKEALDKIGALFGIERAIAGKRPGQRMAVRAARAKPKLDALASWFDGQLKLISGKSDLAKAIRYARSRWGALTCYCADGRLYRTTPPKIKSGPWPPAERIGYSRAATPEASAPPFSTRRSVLPS